MTLTGTVPASYRSLIWLPDACICKGAAPRVVDDSTVPETGFDEALAMDAKPW
jgi:hypothetical protein